MKRRSYIQEFEDVDDLLSGFMDHKEAKRKNVEKAMVEAAEKAMVEAAEKPMVQANETNLREEKAEKILFNVFGDALNSMSVADADEIGVREVTITPSHQVITRFLTVMQKHEFEDVDDLLSGKIVVELRGRINGCGVITPRADVGVDDIDYWAKKFLPPTDLFGWVVLATSEGFMDHKEAKRKNVGGKVIGFFY